MQPFVRTSQSTSFGACFRDCGHNSTYMWITTVLIPLCYGESSLRTSSWYVSPLFLTDPSNSHLLLWNYFNRRHFFFYFIFFTHPCMDLCFTVLIIHYAFFPHISTMRLYISTKSVLHNYISYASSSYTLKNLQVKINTWAYHRTHFIQQSKTSHNSKPGHGSLFF